MAKQVVGFPISERDSNNLNVYNIGFQISEEDSINIDASMGKQVEVDRYPISEKASNYIDTLAGNGMFLIEVFMCGLDKNKGGGMELFLTCVMTWLTLCGMSSSFYRACRAFDAGFKGQDKACMIATVLMLLLWSIHYFGLAVPMPIFSNAFFNAVAMVLAFGVFVASLVAFYLRQPQIHAQIYLFH